MKYKEYKSLPPLHSGHNKKVTKKTWVTQGEIPNVIQVSHAIIPAGEECVTHFHDDMHELFIVEEGSGVMIVNGMETIISRGDSLLIYPGESHALINPHEEDLRVIVMGILSSKEARV